MNTLAAYSPCTLEGSSGVLPSLLLHECPYSVVIFCIFCLVDIKVAQGKRSSKTV